jgi:hypothetical protein
MFVPTITAEYLILMFRIFEVPGSFVDPKLGWEEAGIPHSLQ